MTPGHALAALFGAAFLLNAIPHVVSGVLGRAFQTPFATPSGEGLSSSTVNVLWGFLNLAVAWVLLVRTASVDLRAWQDALVLGLGGLPMALLHARYFGRFHGGARPNE